jgi:hypothetical protein
MGAKRLTSTLYGGIGVTRLSRVYRTFGLMGSRVPYSAQGPPRQKSLPCEFLGRFFSGHARTVVRFNRGGRTYMERGVSETSQR